MRFRTRLLSALFALLLGVVSHSRAQSVAPAPPGPPPVPAAPVPRVGPAPVSLTGRAAASSGNTNRFRPLPAAGTNLPTMNARSNPYPTVVRPQLPASWPPPGSVALVADADAKEYTAKPGETNALYTFTLTNVSPAEVQISAIRTSCGCTIAQLPSYPWPMAPGTNVSFGVNVDLRGRRGTQTKTIFVYTTAGMKTLTVKFTIPDAGGMAGMDRGKNIQIASADRQAIFRGDCAQCHTEPAKGKTGQALYAAACGICHDAEHRASMVPDLRNLPHPTNREFWENWVIHGKAGTLMPAFAKEQGGILDDAQVKSLVDFLAAAIPSRPAAAQPAPVAAPAIQAR